MEVKNEDNSIIRTESIQNDQKQLLEKINDHENRQGDEEIQNETKIEELREAINAFKVLKGEIEELIETTIPDLNKAEIDNNDQKSQMKNELEKKDAQEEKKGEQQIQNQLGNENENENKDRNEKVQKEENNGQELEIEKSKKEGEKGEINEKVQKIDMEEQQENQKVEGDQTQNNKINETKEIEILQKEEEQRDQEEKIEEEEIQKEEESNENQDMNEERNGEEKTEEKEKQKENEEPEVKHITVVGSGDLEECISKLNLYDILQVKKPCIEPESHCSFNGASIPRVNFDELNFIAVSEYWFTLFDVHGFIEYDYDQFRNVSLHFCSKDWQELFDLHQNGHFTHASLSRLESQCFKSAWIMQILHDGFKFPLPSKTLSNFESQQQRRELEHNEKENEINNQNQSNGNEDEDISKNENENQKQNENGNGNGNGNENRKEADEIKILEKIAKRNPHIVKTIDGIEVSWTLGALLLELVDTWDERKKIQFTSPIQLHEIIGNEIKEEPKEEEFIPIKGKLVVSQTKVTKNNIWSVVGMYIGLCLVITFLIEAYISTKEKEIPRPLSRMRYKIHRGSDSDYERDLEADISRLGYEDLWKEV